ncbi:hypothetical protein OH76DRAFT_1474881 [Lentinus brumalis]|uniref:Transmembrane protein n=1 Tax=Lentinus brumalis TaxID=2498619 RepID=A0A371CSY6_9APHY|nr:hypothetical protein OH76DRAFT_1474881 [Polyporus brumalis]
MRAFDNLYEEPTFEAPTRKEQHVVYAALGTVAVAVASTVAAVAALQMNGAPSWLSAAYVRLQAATDRDGLSLARGHGGVTVCMTMTVEFWRCTGKRFALGLAYCSDTPSTSLGGRGRNAHLERESQAVTATYCSSTDAGLNLARQGALHTTVAVILTVSLVALLVAFSLTATILPALICGDQNETYLQHDDLNRRIITTAYSTTADIHYDFMEVNGMLERLYYQDGIAVPLCSVREGDVEPVFRHKFIGKENTEKLAELACKSLGQLVLDDREDRNLYYMARHIVGC